MAIVPKHNTKSGQVSDTEEALSSLPGLSEVLTFPVEVSHCLLTHKSFANRSPTHLQEVHSKEQALTQCSSALSKLFPVAVLVPSPSTSSGMSSALSACATGVFAGAVGCEDLREVFEDAVVIERNLNDGGDRNVTVFACYVREGA